MDFQGRVSLQRKSFTAKVECLCQGRNPFQERVFQPGKGIPAMRILGRKIRYKFDYKVGEENMVIAEDNQEIKLNTYLEDHVNKSLHEIIRTNIMNATRNYNHRVKAFIKEIIMDKSNPMSVKHFSTKVEFQGRGASHNHGTLWVDLPKMEYNFEDKDGNCKKIDDLLNKKGISDKTNCCKI